MGQTPNINAASPGSQTFGSSNTLNDLDLDDFLNLMLAELQNQDPLNPLENDELIAQISQIREVGATEKLTATLDSVLLGQNISSATSLIGAEIDAISDDGQRVTGAVDRVSINNGTPSLHIDTKPSIQRSDQAGDIDVGSYRYQVTWEDENGNLFGIETQESISLDSPNQSVLISNLPATSTQKQIYRTDASGKGPLKLVAVLPDGTTSSYRDTSADEDLSSTVLTRTPSLISTPTRSFKVSLNNVGEIRPRGT